MVRYRRRRRKDDTKALMVVAAVPGVAGREIMARTGWTYGRTYRALRRLERAGKVRSKVVYEGGVAPRVRYWPT
jgi:hypothetical protein